LNFGSMLRTLRLSAGISLRELSRNIDVSPTYLSLVENAKQAPPNAVRIAQIEQALQVPSGSLTALTDGLGAATAEFVRGVPEAMDFLDVAKVESMTSADFMELTGFLNEFGWERIRLVLKGTTATAPRAREDSHGRGADGFFLWPFLSEELIFDAVEDGEKEDFLRRASALMAVHNDGINEDALLMRLLERENVSSTGIGGGIAIPHAFLPELDRMVVALARMPQGLDFDSVDGRPVCMALFLVGPKSSENLHLKLLARTAKLLSHKNFLASLLEASGPGEIISIFRAAEMGIP